MIKKYKIIVVCEFKSLTQSGSDKRTEETTCDDQAKATAKELLDYSDNIQETFVLDCELEKKQKIEQYNLFNPQYNQTKT